MSGEEPGPEAAGAGWFAASLDQILDQVRANDLGADFADDLAEVRDMALMVGDWAMHRAACGGYFFTVTIHMQSQDQLDSHVFAVPHDPDAARFMAKLTQQLGLLAGRCVQDQGVMRALPSDRPTNRRSRWGWSAWSPAGGAP